LPIFKGSGKIKKSMMEDPDKLDVILASDDVTRSFCGPEKKTFLGVLSAFPVPQAKKSPV